MNSKQQAPLAVVRIGFLERCLPLWRKTHACAKDGGAGVRRHGGVSDVGALRLKMLQLPQTTCGDFRPGRPFMCHGEWPCQPSWQLVLNALHESLIPLAGFIAVLLLTDTV